MKKVFDYMNSLPKEIKWLLTGFTASISFLVFFINAKNQDYSYLDLDVKWILLSGVPLLLALFLGGFIKSFKGLGIELEANLQEPIPSSLISRVEFIPQLKLTKESLVYLYNLNEQDKLHTNVLQFITKKHDWYDSNAIREYITRLPNLKFIEIVDNQLRFKFLLPITILMVGRQLDYDAIGRFIEYLEKGNIVDGFPEAMSNHVSTDDNLITVYDTFEKSINNYIRHWMLLPVLNKKQQFVGVVYKQSIDTKIAEDVIRRFKK